MRTITSHLSWVCVGVLGIVLLVMIPPVQADPPAEPSVCCNFYGPLPACCTEYPLHGPVCDRCDYSHPGQECTAPAACCLPNGRCVNVDPACCGDMNGEPCSTVTCSQYECGELCPQGPASPEGEDVENVANMSPMAETPAETQETSPIALPVVLAALLLVLGAVPMVIGRRRTMRRG